MPTNIATGVKESEDRLKAEKAIAERFPDAYLAELAGDFVWMAESASEHVTDVTIVTWPHYQDYERDRGMPRIQTGVYTHLTVEGMRVYARPGGNSQHLVFLGYLRDKQPEVYKALVAAAKV